MQRIFYLFFIILLINSTLNAKSFKNGLEVTIDFDTIKFFDQTRHREIPIAIYKPHTKNITHHQRVVILSHGYNENRSGSYLGYSYLTNFLASNGYFVVSIQHELPTDSLLPSKGIPSIVRRPCWDRGVENIYFVINELKKIYPSLNYKQLTLIGHSNGGDMTALFPQKYPNMISKIITLDNRRMFLPRTKRPQVYSLRSCDQLADEGVLPTELEVKKYKIVIIKLSNTTHNEMSDNANEIQRKEIQRCILKFLSN